MQLIKNKTVQVHISMGDSEKELELEPEVAIEIEMADELEEFVIGRINRTNMAGPVYVSIFFGTMTPVFSWWGLAVVSRSRRSALALAPGMAECVRDGSTVIDAMRLACKSWEDSHLHLHHLDHLDHPLAMLNKARVLDNLSDGMLVQLFLGDEPLITSASASASNSEKTSASFVSNTPFYCGQMARTVALGQVTLGHEDVKHDEYHAMTSVHRHDIFETCDALAACGLRLHLVAQTFPRHKLIEVPTRAAYMVLEGERALEWFRARNLNTSNSSSSCQPPVSAEIALELRMAEMEADATFIANALVARLHAAETTADVTGAVETALHGGGIHSDVATRLVCAAISSTRTSVDNPVDGGEILNLNLKRSRSPSDLE